MSSPQIIHHTAYLSQCTLPRSGMSTQHNFSIWISSKVTAWFYHLLEHTKGCTLGFSHGCMSSIVLDVDINARMGEKCSCTAGLIFPCSQMKSSIATLVVGTMIYFLFHKQFPHSTTCLVINMLAGRNPEDHKKLQWPHSHPQPPRTHLASHQSPCTPSSTHLWAAHNLSACPFLPWGVHPNKHIWNNYNWYTLTNVPELKYNQVLVCLGMSHKIPIASTTPPHHISDPMYGLNLDQLVAPAPSFGTGY